MMVLKAGGIAAIAVAAFLAFKNDGWK